MMRVLQRVKRRTLRPGKGGKRRKGNGKGKRQRGSFNPFRKAPTGGKASMADEITTDQAYWGKKGSKNLWSNKGKGKSWVQGLQRKKIPARTPSRKDKTFATEHTTEIQDATQHPVIQSAEPAPEDCKNTPGIPQIGATAPFAHATKMGRRHT